MLDLSKKHQVRKAKISKKDLIKKIDATSNPVSVIADTAGTADLIDGSATAIMTVPNTSIQLQDSLPDVWYIN